MLTTVVKRRPVDRLPAEGWQPGFVFGSAEHLGESAVNLVTAGAGVPWGAPAPDRGSVSPYGRQKFSSSWLFSIARAKKP
ncbi:hypothetical protein J2Z30_008320 [Streptomyces iranensis]|uniref:Uncharacterized protein n=1 Tax=Streptomyces iranensis TaxID=576784 RepID=A0ABS4N5I3_9ACTN|nr:hypothetical protein [Streptomyces iranensis]